MRSRLAWVVLATVAITRRPDLWSTAARQTTRLATPGWWRRWPFLPLPSRRYLRFRMVTMYGDPEHAPVPDDLVVYLEWCRSWHAVVTPGGITRTGRGDVD